MVVFTARQQYIPVMLKTIIFCICVLLFPACRDISPANRLLTEEDFTEETCHGIQHELIARKKAVIGNDAILDAVVEVSAKGNGLLRIADIKPKIFDEYDNTEIFTRNPILVCLTDINGDGYQDLLICGVKKVCDDKGKFLAFRPEFFLWLFQPERKSFDTPFGIFDPYSEVRNYFDEIPLPERRIVLSEKYRLNSNALRDEILLDLTGNGTTDKIAYGLTENASGELCCLLEIYRWEHNSNQFRLLFEARH
ncbi:hypothetical protein SDC9_125280 [bioreactor metagenome]|uniref:Uncharacterized protein n=1 Tax=bioreactor metagenome TaxID=1076179 RepID=A0A645CMZ2_9ZZZZ